MAGVSQPPGRGVQARRVRREPAMSGMRWDLVIVSARRQASMTARASASGVKTSLVQALAFDEAVLRRLAGRAVITCWLTQGGLIGIGGRLATPPLPHHRASTLSALQDWSYARAVSATNRPSVDIIVESSVLKRE